MVADPLSLALFAAGTATSLIGSSQARKQERRIAAANNEINRTRKELADLQALRETRDALRRGQAARAAGINAAANSGSGLDSSIVGGAIGQISGATNLAANAISQNQDAGSRIFDLQNSIGQAQDGLGTARTISSVGSFLSSNARDFSDLARNIREGQS